MNDFVKTVSHELESQFPQIYREEGEELVSFLKAYYEFLETNPESYINRGKNLPEYGDIDETLDEFVNHFREKYLKDFPFVSATDKRFMVKHISDYYRSKGSSQSIKLLMQLLYGEEIEVYYPNKDVFKTSSSDWHQPEYIEVTSTPRLKEYHNSEIQGVTSGARAVVDGIVTKRVNGKYINVLYMSEIRGRFIRDEQIVLNDGALENAPVITGSLSGLEVTIGGRNNSVGDIFDIVSQNGLHGKARVAAIEDATGRADFTIQNGGSGYTLTDSTEVYVSDSILFIDNPQEDFIEFEEVVQPFEDVQYLSGGDIEDNWQEGDYIVGVDPSGTPIANGTIAQVSSNTVTIAVREGTFGDQKSITFADNVGFTDKEYVVEEDSVTLDITNLVGTFSVGERVEQTALDTINGKEFVNNHAIGIVDSANSTTVTLSEVFGEFITDQIFIGADSSAQASPTSVVKTEIGARGRVSEIQSTDTVVVQNVFGSFTSGKKVRGDLSRKISSISSISSTGVSDLWLNGNSSANAVVYVVSNNHVTGIVIGQNTSCVGLYGNSAPFMQGGGMFVQTNRESLLSPPRDANGDIVEIRDRVILEIATGFSADFEIGSLENEETVTLNTDMIGANNYAEIPFVDVGLDGSNSGIGFVDSVNVIDGGSGYSNGTIATFSAGGYAGGEPITAGTGVVSTDANGTITDVEVTNPGAGYFETPVIDIGNTSGTSANVEVQMDYGYGFVKNPDGDDTNFIGDLLTIEDFTIGTISSLSRINPGQNYNVNPFVNVYNKYITTYNRGNFTLDIINLQGSFVPGEVITQEIDTETFGKGRVISANTSVVNVERTSFGVAFQDGFSIIGSSTGTIAEVNKITPINGDEVMGHNAIIDGKVIAANGIATELEIIDSGHGYLEGEIVSVQNDDTVFLIEGRTEVKYHGVGEGYWRDTVSHISDKSKLHDNDYYQEFSYDIISGRSINRYRDIVKKLSHVAGTKMFGSVENQSNVNVSNYRPKSTISIE